MSIKKKTIPAPTEPVPIRETDAHGPDLVGPQAVVPDGIGFRLLKLTNLLSRPFFSEFAQPYALSLSEWRAIVVLAALPGSAAQDIAKATGLHPMNVSRAVISLRKASLVREERDPANHRRVLLWLTDQGRSTFDEIAPRSAAAAAQLLAVLTPVELAQLNGLLNKLIDRAEVIVGSSGEDGVPSP